MGWYNRLSMWPALAKINRELMATGFPKVIEIDAGAWDESYAQILEMLKRTKRPRVNANESAETGFMYCGCLIKARG